MVTISRSTYAQIIDDLRADLEEDTRVAAWQEEYWMGLILRAEEKVCQAVAVKEEYRLRLTEGVTEYYLQDRPVISNVTVASPIVTAEGHGLTPSGTDPETPTDVIFIRDVLGNLGVPDGRYQATVLSDDTFSIRHFRRISDATNADPIVITTLEDHPYESGDSVLIAEVEGNTAANGTHVITKLTERTFSIPVAGTDSYSGGGIATKNAVGSGAYASGGRFWKENEIPSYFRAFRMGVRLFQSRTYRTLPALSQQVERWKEDEGFRSYNALEAPQEMAIRRRTGRRYLQFYPDVAHTEDIVLTGLVQVIPKDYYDTDENGTMIHLETEHDPVIKAYVKARAYERLKEYELMKHCDGLYHELLDTYRATVAPQRSTIEVSYE